MAKKNVIMGLDGKPITGDKLSYFQGLGGSLELREMPRLGDKVRLYLFCDSCMDKPLYYASGVMEYGSEDIEGFINKVADKGIDAVCKACGDILEVKTIKTKYDKDCLKKAVIID